MSMNMAVCDKQHEYTTAAIVSKESHEMLTKIPQMQINQCCSDTHANRAQDNRATHHKVINKMLILLVVLIAVILFISLAALMLSVINFKATSKLFIKFDATNNDLTSLATNVETNMSQLFIQLDALNSLTITEQAQNTKLYCGDGVWYRVAYLNMSNAQCPSAWREYDSTDSGNITACGRASSTTGSCSSVSFSMPGGLHSRMCGRVIGYQFATPDGFRKFAENDSIPFDGINITYGTQRYHIWSYVAGITENSTSHGHPLSNCPCSTGQTPPPFIGDRYYCESGNPNESFEDLEIFPDDPLWDGQQCEGTCCTGTNSPPWFSVQLPAPTTDHDEIEVSICGDEPTNNGDTPIVLLEIYVQ